ncbi:MAG: MFS transporter, partial [Bryobacteraceae bacterium]
MYKWQSLALLFFIGAINYADRTALSAVFPLVQRDLGMSNVGLAAIGSLFLWSYAIGSPIAGAVADRFPRSRMIFWSLVGWSAVTLATALVRNQEQLFLARVLLGMAECAYLPAAFAFISDYHQDKTRATA